MSYLEDIQKAASEVILEKKASQKNAVHRKVEEMLSKVASEEDLDSSVLSEKALRALGLDEYVLLDEEEQAEEDEEEAEDDAEEEAEDEAEEETDKEDDEQMNTIKEAQEYLQKALALEKEATEAFNEAQIWKIASLKLLYENGQITEEIAEKVASMSYDELIEK